MSNKQQSEHLLAELKYHERFVMYTAGIRTVADSPYDTVGICDNTTTIAFGTENIITVNGDIKPVELTFAEVVKILQELPMLSARNRNWTDDFNGIYLSVSTTGELYFERCDRTYLGKANHIPGINLHDKSWYVCNLYKTNYDNYECSED